MVRFTALAWLLATASGLFSRVDALLKSGDALPGQFIVEYAQSPVEGTSNLALDAVQSLLGLDLGIEIHFEYDYSLFKGALISLGEVEEPEALMARLRDLNTIQQVWPNRYLTRTNSAKQRSWVPSSFDRRGAFESNATYATHVSTQVNLLHEKGFYGNGTKIFLVDGGVDYTLDALGGCFGLDCLIAYGYDFVGDNYNGTNTPVPDPDPLDQCSDDSHGTHTTGIIGAQPGNIYGILGAAPGATLGMYRISSCNDESSISLLIQGYLQAFEDGADIIFASLGHDSGWKDDLWAVVVSRIVGAGVPVIGSAGNDGASGLFIATAPSEGDGVTGVASFVNAMEPLYDIFTNYTIDGGAPQEFHWAPGNPGAWDGVSLPLYAPSLNASNPNFGCNPYPDDTPDLSGYIVLVGTVGGCDWDDQAKNAAAKGAKYLIQFTYDYHGTWQTYLDPSDGMFAAADVDNFQAQTWLELLAGNHTVTVYMANSDTTAKHLKYRKAPALGGYLDYSSEWSPTFEMDIRPMFGVPGANILSTVSKTVDPEGFGVMSGTSMAAPLAAAIHALVGQVRGTHDPATLQHLISATAKAALHSTAQTYTDALRNGKTFPFFAPVPKQGSGMIQAYDAAFTTMILNRTSIAFNDTANLVPTTGFTITNLGNADIRITLGHVGAGTAYTFNKDDPMPASYDTMEVTEEYAAVDFTVSQVTVPAGGKVEVIITIRPPDLDGKRIPVYSGYITGNSTNGDSFALPYAGAVGSLKEVKIMAQTWFVNSTSAFESGVAITNGTTGYIFPESGPIDCQAVPCPEVWIQVAFGTRFLDVQVVDVTTGKELGSITSTPVYSTNQLNPYDQIFNGTLADGSTVPAGTYIFEFSALKVFGDPKNDKDYERSRSAQFTIDYR